MDKKTSPLIVVVSTLLCFGVVSEHLGCKDPTGALNPNSPPRTRLANVPQNDPRGVYLNLGVIPEVTLNWVGDDPDGFVVAYRYRWTDIATNGTQRSTSWTTLLNIARIGGVDLQNMILVAGTPSSLASVYKFLTTINPADSAAVRIIGDSLATLRPFAVPYKNGPVAGDSIVGGRLDVNLTPTIGKFIFNSPVDSNSHKFEVASVDNNNAVDPNPAFVIFWTKQSPGPLQRIAARPDSGTFMIRHTTERWRGARFVFFALDPSTDELFYSWSVDDTSRWSRWQIETEAYITASDFSNPDSSGGHRFYVRSKNRWGVISAPRDTIFFAEVPAFDRPGFAQRTLIVNNNNRSSRSPAGTPDSNQTKSYYAQVMDSLGRRDRYDIWTCQSQSPVGAFPSKRTLGRYSSVLLVSEVRISPLSGGNDYIIKDTKQVLLNAYLEAGGKLVFSSPPDIDQAVTNFATGFGNDPLHIVGSFKITVPEFKGARGILGYPTVVLDTTRLPQGSGNPINGISANGPRGFAETISFYTSRSGNPQYDILPLGVRFLAPPPVPPARTTYSIVFLGFPLYYVDRSGAIGTLRQAFLDINE